jgi:TM2 domain-containing membrane protein YozV
MASASPTPVGRGKDKLTAGLLAFFLGFLGIHHFYLGSTTAGIICIPLSCCTGGLGVLLPLIEASMLLRMDQNAFDAKYNLRTPEPMEFVFTGPQ